MIEKRHPINDFSHLWKIHFKFEKQHLRPGMKKSKTPHEDLRNILSFDIETSSGYLYKDHFIADYSTVSKSGLRTWDGGHTVPHMAAIMYIWQFAIEEPKTDTIHVFFGRTWDDFKNFWNTLLTAITYHKATGSPAGSPQTFANYSKKHIDIHIYIHNLAFEFQFLRNVLDFKEAKVFARTSRKPMKISLDYAETCHVRLHDTLCLTQKSLANWCKDAQLEFGKLTGDLDYSKIRTPETPISEKELGYCAHDVLAVVEGISKYRDKYHTLSNIPMTQTGEIRRTLEKVAMNDRAWSKRMGDITNWYTYQDICELQEIYWGGWTHANISELNVTHKDILGNDFTSSYPATMCMDKYPVSRFEPIDPADLPNYQNGDYRYYLLAEIRNVRSKMKNTLIPAYKCIEAKGAIYDNGKIYSADYIKIRVTDLDWEMMHAAYDFDEEIIEVKVAEADYLCRDLILMTLSYFQNKCKYDGIPDKYSQYVESKQFINSIYGVAVTRVIAPEIIFDGSEWKSIPVDEAKYIEDTAKQRNRYWENCEKLGEKTHDKTAHKGNYYLCYQIGVWVAAFARYHLWELICALDKHVIYGDTDSLKGRFDANDLDKIDQYNRRVDARVQAVCTARNIDPSLYIGTKPNGKQKHLGYFADDMDATEFRTLGAKRYCYIDRSTGKLKVVLAGVPKNAGSRKILQLWEQSGRQGSPVDFFDADNPELKWSARESDKKIHYYFDDQPPTDWIDYEGRHYHSEDRYGIALDQTEFSLSIDQDFYLLSQLVDDTDFDDFPTDLAYEIRNGRKLKN